MVEEMVTGEVAATVMAGDTARLFDGYRSDDLLAHPELLFARLLEEGDSADLRRLFAAVPEERVRRFFRHHGGRTASRRSRRFWSLLLDAETTEPPELTAEIWPL